MFDGLKDKLSSFTKETEEDVDDEAIETPDDESAASAEKADETGEVVDAAVSGETEVSDSEAETASESVSSLEAESKTAGASATEAESATEPDTAVEDEEVTGEASTPDEEETAADTDEDSGRSLRERAKLFATGKAVIDEDDLDSHLGELEFALLGSDVEYEVTHEILDGVEQALLGETRRRLESTGNIVQDALREALYDVISVGQFDFDAHVQEGEKPVVIIFTGVNGVGKTTSIAKLAHYFEERGLSSVLANGDTFRAGANEQLEQHAQNLNKKIISHEQGSDPAAVIYDAVEYAKANDVDVVLGDTAGRLHTSDGLMAQLSKIDRVIEPDMTLFVDEAVAGQDAVNRAREFDEAAAIDGAILTKADADTSGGAAISVAHVTGKPILFLGTGQGYDDLERFDPQELVDALVGAE